MSAADKLAQVLAEHGLAGMAGGFGDQPDAKTHACRCDRRWVTAAEYAAHVAAVVLAHLTAEGWAQGEAAPPEIRHATLADGSTELDEVVARNASVHLEAMVDNAWWLGIESGGQMVHVNFGTKRAKITGTAEEV